MMGFLAKRAMAWTSATALVLILLQLGAPTCRGTPLDSAHSVQHYARASHSYPPSNTGVPIARRQTCTAALFEYASKYRPRIVDMPYNMGPVLWKPINVYIVWYGGWTWQEKNVIRNALWSLTPNVPITQTPNLSQLWQVATKYYEQRIPGTPRKFVTKSVTVRNEVDDGLNPANKTVNSDEPFENNPSAVVTPLDIIIRQINLGNLPLDPEQGAYFVLTAPDITYSNIKKGSDVKYCGYHKSSCLAIGNSTELPNCDNITNNLIYAFVPMPTENDTQFGNCNVFDEFNVPGTPPNSAVSSKGYLDSMVSIILHELLELAADPYPEDLPAWRYSQDSNSETADFCTFNFVAGQWFYCDPTLLIDLYYDFNQSSGQCMALGSFPAPTNPPRSLRESPGGVSFNLYGLNGYKFLVQKMWSLDNKGCVLVTEEKCPNATVVTMDVSSGKIQRGFFFNGVGLQSYAPGQNCGWRLKFTQQRKVTFTFEILALAFDDLDYIMIWQNGVVVTKLTGFAQNQVVDATGTDFGIRFVTYPDRSPYPISAGFTMCYASTVV